MTSGVGPPPPTARPLMLPPGPAEAWCPRPYPQLLRGPNLRWWRPVVGLAVGLVVAGLGSLAVGTVGAVAFLLSRDGGVTATAASTVDTAAFDRWMATAPGLLYLNLSLALLIPAAMLATWAGFGWRPRWLGSVTGGLRWRWLGGCFAVGLVLLGGLTVAAQALSGGLDWSPEPGWPGVLLVVALTTPLQAAGEEYFFRGWIPQLFGSMIPNARVGAVVGGGLSTTIFAFAHGQQDPWLFADRFGFGVVACLLVWWTGGLEAGIALHAVNNLVAFGLTIGAGQLSEALSPTESTPEALVVDLVTLLIAAAVLLVLARRGHLVRLFTPPRPLAAPATPFGWAPEGGR
jgi:uncharacterized protein